MNQDLWTAIDEYFVRTWVPSDTVLDATLWSRAEAGLPPLMSR